MQIRHMMRPPGGAQTQSTGTGGRCVEALAPFYTSASIIADAAVDPENSYALLHWSLAGRPSAVERAAQRVRYFSPIFRHAPSSQIHTEEQGASFAVTSERLRTATGLIGLDPGVGSRREAQLTIRSRLQGDRAQCMPSRRRTVRRGAGGRSHVSPTRQGGERAPSGKSGPYPASSLSIGSAGASVGAAAGRSR